MQIFKELKSLKFHSGDVRFFIWILLICLIIYFIHPIDKESMLSGMYQDLFSIVLTIISINFTLITLSLVNEKKSIEKRLPLPEDGAVQSSDHIFNVIDRESEFQDLIDNYKSISMSPLLVFIYVLVAYCVNIGIDFTPNIKAYIVVTAVTQLIGFLVISIFKVITSITPIY